MKKIISFQLVLALVCSTLSLQVFAKEDKCTNGECVEKLIDKLENLGKLYKNQCLPKNIKQADIPKYQEKNGISEECWKILNDVKDLEDQLAKLQSKLEARLGCESSNCKLPNAGMSLNAQIKDLSKLEGNVCTKAKKQEIKNKCTSDLGCVVTASALGVGGYLAEILVPAKFKQKDCHLGNDSCVTQLATSFIKAAVTFFQGAWWIVSSAGKYAGKKMGEFWNWVKGAEDHSSTSQLAMAKVSEDNGIFNEFKKDFPGTMKKVFSTFVASLKEWMKNDVLCQKWAGVPRASKCLKPTTSFDCIPCKNMVTGLCSISGTLVAEVVPAFLSGGLSIAIKNGVNGAAKIATLFRASQKGIQAVKSTKLGQAAVVASAKTDEILRVSKSVHAAKDAVTAALKAIRTYMLSPSRNTLKSAYTSMTTALSKGGVYIAETPVGKVLVFSGTVLKNSLKTVLYPVDNPLTKAAYKTGYRSFDKVFKMGQPKLASKSVVAAAILQKDPTIETTLAKLEEAKLADKVDRAKVLQLEKELLTKVTPVRSDAAKIALSKANVEFNDVVKNLYPELQYGPLAKKLSSEKISAVEKQLYIEISSLADGAKKTKLMNNYRSYVTGNQLRASVAKDIKSPFDSDVKLAQTPTTPSPNPSDEVVTAGIIAPRVIKRPVRNSAEGNIIFKDGDAADLHTKTEIGHVLKNLKSTPNASLYVNIVPDTKGHYVFRVSGLDQKSAEEVIETLMSNEKLTHGFNEQFRLGRNQLNIEVPTNESGLMKTDNLRFRADTVVLEEPIEPPLNFTRGFFKLMSPTLRAGEHQSALEEQQAPK